MDNKIFNIDNIKYKRIDKRTAARFYENGRSILICAKNENPETTKEKTIINVNDEKHYKSDVIKAYSTANISAFSLRVSIFELLNCNTENGRYCAFYAALN